MCYCAPLGTISVGKKRYVFVDYHWEQSWAHAVGFPHAADRLLVLTLAGKRLTYIGFYDEDMKPIGIRGNKVIFPYPESWGNALTIGENGLQAEPWFGGRTHALGK